MSALRPRVTHRRRWRGCPRFFRGEACKSRKSEILPPPPPLSCHPSPLPHVDYTVRILVHVARGLDAGRAEAYVEAYGVPAAGAVVERHGLVWVDDAVVARLGRRLEERTGADACAARAFLRVWAPALRRPGLLVPIVDGGRFVSAKIYRPPDADGKRGKYFLRGLGGRYLWGADEVEEALRASSAPTIFIVEGEGDKMAIDGACAAGGVEGVIAVCGGGTGLAGDAVRLARIAAWRDPLLEAAGGRRPRVVVVADPDAAGRAAAVRIAEATGAEVAFPAADARDLIARGARVA